MWPAERGTLERLSAHTKVQRVLMTADAVGGVWRYAMDLGGTLAERGVAMSLAVMGPPPGAAARRDAERRGLAVLHRPYRLEWMDDPWEDVRRAGSWLLALERTLMPDIVHLNGYAHAALPWRAPAVVVAHSCVRSWWRAVKGEAAPDRFDRYREAVADGLERAQLVIAPTRAMLGALQEEYGVRPHARVIPNGCAPLAPVTPPLSEPKEPFILAAGRVWDDAKNIRALCDAADRLPWPVYVAGDDTSPGGQPCGMAGVRRLGRIQPDDLAAWYRRAAIYALPAKYEPFGLSVLEAASAGCALVLGDIESLRENWSGAAVFVPPDDRGALACAIHDLVDRPARRRELAERATARAAELSVEHTAGEYLRLYEDLAE